MCIYTYVLSEQQSHFKEIFICSNNSIDAGCFDPKVFVNCRVQRTLLSLQSTLSYG